MVQDPALWRRLAAMSQEQGFHRQAIYCLNRVLASDRSDLGAQWDRACLFALIGENRKVGIQHSGCGNFTIFVLSSALISEPRPGQQSGSNED